LDGPWPAALISQGDFRRSLLDHLWSPGTSFARGARQPPDQVYHFACHCSTSDAKEDEHHLRLRFGPASADLVLKIGDLYSDRIDRQVDEHRPLPLIFLNACESAGGVLGGIPSFPRVFLANNHLGFIGTEVPVRDKYAALFSRRFYTLLLEG